MKRFITLCSIIAMFATTAGADTRNTVTGKARVLRSQPTESYVNKTVEPVNICKIVEVPIYGKGNDDAGALLGGAIIGGIIGNGVSNSSGAGAVGAIIGGAIANEHQKKHNRPIVGYRQENHCTTEYRNVETKNYQCYTIVELIGFEGYTFSFTENNCYKRNEIIDIRLDVSIRR